MDKFKFLFISLPLLSEFSLLQIEASIGSDSRFNSEHFRYLTNVLNKSETGFLPSRSLHIPFSYPSTPASHFNNGIEPHSSIIQQTPQHLYPGPHPPFQSQGQQFQQRDFPYSLSLPIGYFPTQFGGHGTQTSPLSSPYPVLPFGTPSPYPQFTLPAPRLEFPIPHYPHQHRPFPTVPPPPPPPQFQDGFDVGSLPKQVQVPGTMALNLVGKDAEISCEFPKYLILVQGIYWHHMYGHDPFGAYFDTQNGFGEHTTVRAISQWKSVLVIRDYNADDFGIYRCLSTALLPAELEPTAYPSNTSPPNLKPKHEHFRITPNPTPPLPTIEADPPYHFESAESMNPSGHFNEILKDSPASEKKQRASRFMKNSRKMRFPPAEEIKRRVTRQLPTTPTYQNHQGKNVPLRRDLPTSPSTNYYHFPQTMSYSYSPQDFGYRKLTNPFVEVDPFPTIQSNQIRNERYLPHFHLGYPGFGFGIPPSPTYPLLQTGYGLKVPYYKPAYSYCTIYQEIKFDPVGVRSRQGRTTHIKI